MSRERAVGSGVVIDPDGYVITNYHVVAGLGRNRRRARQRRGAPRAPRLARCAVQRPRGARDSERGAAQPALRRLGRAAARPARHGRRRVGLHGGQLRQGRRRLRPRAVVGAEHGPARGPRADRRRREPRRLRRRAHHRRRRPRRPAHHRRARDADGHGRRGRRVRAVVEQHPLHRRRHHHARRPPPPAARHRVPVQPAHRADARAGRVRGLPAGGGRAGARRRARQLGRGRGRARGRRRRRRQRGCPWTSPTRS